MLGLFCRVIITVVLICTLGLGATSPLKLKLQGKLFKNKFPYTGTMNVRILLTDQTGKVLWQSHENQDLALSINNSAYVVELGNYSLQGMRPLTPDVFSKKNTYYISILSNDKKIINKLPLSAALSKELREAKSSTSSQLDAGSLTF